LHFIQKYTQSPGFEFHITYTSPSGLVVISSHHLLIPPHHNQFSLRLHQTLFVAKSGGGINMLISLLYPELASVTTHSRYSFVSPLLLSFPSAKHYDIIKRVILACAAFFRACRLSGSREPGPLAGSDENSTC
jgi:hypothetical protein